MCVLSLNSLSVVTCALFACVLCVCICLPSVLLPDVHCICADQCVTCSVYISLSMCVSCVCVSAVCSSQSRDLCLSAIYTCLHIRDIYALPCVQYVYICDINVNDTQSYICMYDSVYMHMMYVYTVYIYMQSCYMCTHICMSYVYICAFIVLDVYCVASVFLSLSLSMFLSLRVCVCAILNPLSTQATPSSLVLSSLCV